MKILVLGRQGQVARSLMEADPRAGVEMVAVGRPDFDLCDAGSAADCITRHRPDLVINAAAYTQVDRAESDEAAAFAANADGAAHVAQACASHDIALIHLSTDFVFDGLKHKPYCEADQTNPLNAYGRSKREGELRVAALCTKHLIVRTSWVYSPWGSNFILTMLRLAKDRSVITVVDDQHGNPTYAPHLAELLMVLAHRAIARPSDMAWGIYHAAGQGETTWCGFAREVFRCAQTQGLPFASVMPIATADYPTPAKRPQNSRLDCSAFARQMNLLLPDWRRGVQTCVSRVNDEARTTLG